MNCEIVCVGTELLLGDIVNTNAAWLAKQLAELGINVYYQSVVGDNPARLKNVLESAFAKSRSRAYDGRTRPYEGRPDKGDGRFAHGRASDAARAVARTY